MKSGPKSFRQMFKDKPQVKFQESVPFVPVPHVPTPEEVKRKQFKHFLNNQRCMVCGGQIDGVVERPISTQTCSKANHFRAVFDENKDLPISVLSIFRFNNAIDYEIVSHLTSDNYLNVIYRVEKEAVFHTRKLADYKGELLWLEPNLTEKQFMDMIQMIMVFDG